MAQRIEVLSDPFNDPADGEHMEFRLIYQGALRSTQRDPKPDSGVPTKHWQLKHQIRQQLHPQLKRLWEVHPLLKVASSEKGSPFYVPGLAAINPIPPWNFVPLITGDIDMVTSLEVTLLRLDHPGESIWSGDIENRVKTLIDALEVPGIQDGYGSLIPGPGEQPFYCLLENDKLLNNLSIVTDRLLAAPPGADASFAHVTIALRARQNRALIDTTGF